MIGNQTGTRQVPWRTENRSQNNITNSLWFYCAQPLGILGSFWRKESWRSMHIVMGRQGLDVSLAAVKLPFLKNSIDPPLLRGALSEPLSQVCVWPQDKSEAIFTGGYAWWPFFTMDMKGLATYTLMFLSVVNPCYTNWNVIGFSHWREQTWHPLSSESLKVWPRGKKAFPQVLVGLLEIL